MYDRRAAGRNCDDWENQKFAKCYNPCPPRPTYCPPSSSKNQLCNFVPQCVPLGQISNNRTINRPPYRFSTQLTEIPAPCPGKPLKTSRTNMKGCPNKAPLYLVPVVYVPEKIIVKNSVMTAQCQRKPLRNQCQMPCISKSQIRVINTYKNQGLCPQTCPGKSRERVTNGCQNIRPRTCPSLSRRRNPSCPRTCPSWSQDRVSSAHQNPKPCLRTCPSLSRERGMNAYQNTKCPRTCPSWQTKPCPSVSRETRSGVLCNVKSLSDFSSIIISQAEGSNSIVFKRSLNSSSKRSMASSSKRSMTSSSRISLGNLMLSCSRSFPSFSSSAKSTRQRSTNKAACLSAASFRTYDTEKSRELLEKSHSTLTATCLCPKGNESDKDLKEIKSILTAKSIKRPNFDSEELIIKSNDKSCKDLKVTITTEYIGNKVRKPENSRSRDKPERKMLGKDATMSEHSREKKSEGTSSQMKVECLCPVDKVDRKDKPVRKSSKDHSKRVRPKTSKEIKDEGTDVRRRSLKKETPTKSNSSQRKASPSPNKSKGQKRAISGKKSKTSKVSKETNAIQNKSTRALSNIKSHELYCDENCDYDCKFTQTRVKKVKTEPVENYPSRQFERTTKTQPEKVVLGSYPPERYYEEGKPNRKCFCSPSRKHAFKNSTKEPPLYLSQNYY